MKHLHQDRYQSPLGEIVLLADDGKLCYLDFADNDARLEKILRARYREFDAAEKKLPDLCARLDGYFGGDFDAFDGLEFATDGTVFQRSVWRSLQKIPAGKTCSYRQLARAIKKPRAVRAAAGANARNPIAIVIPCHRVINADGTLGGYAGGVARKSWLLAHEGGTEERT